MERACFKLKTIKRIVRYFIFCNAFSTVLFQVGSTISQVVIATWLSNGLYCMLRYATRTLPKQQNSRDCAHGIRILVV